MNKTPTLSADSLHLFPDSYDEGRLSFLRDLPPSANAADRRSYPLNQALSSEAAWIGPPDASSVLILISGTHGVEGAAGTAIQLDLIRRLQSGAATLPPGVAALLLFALNPYGFAAHRRCDSVGIDLNRNFVDFTRPLPANAGYETLRPAIFEADAQVRKAAFEAYRAAHGNTAFEVAVSGGQYADPAGPFFGGTGPAHGNRVVEQVISDYLLAGRRLTVIDLHTGLGPYGYGELICDHPVDSRGFAAAHRWFGAAVASPACGNSSSVPKDGLLDYRWHQLMQHEGCFLTLEFGTYSTEALFDTILRDHRAWQDGGVSARTESARCMLEHFCPKDPFWRESVLVKGRQVTMQALNGLAHE